jgi:hypothetical protein
MRPVALRSPWPQSEVIHWTHPLRAYNCQTAPVKLERQRHSWIPALPPLGEAGAEKINRPCLVLLPGLFASMGDDVCRRLVAVVWAARGAWAG